MNKRGFFLAEETMKIILAVICLGFLLFVLGKMYYSYTVDKEVQQAKDTLARIEKEVNSMKDGDKREIVLYGPGPVWAGTNYWILIGGGVDIPNFCSEKGWSDCLCLCKNIWVEAINSYKSKCDETDVCVSFSGKTLSAPRRDLKNLPITILVTQKGNALSFS